MGMGGGLLGGMFGDEDGGWGGGMTVAAGAR